MTDRLQKLISAAGLMSRRKAEEYINSGRVTVNGETAVLGTKADPENDVIEIDGTAVDFCQEDKVYIVLNKPVGYVTTLSDEKGRKCVSDLVKSVGKRVFPVGRLDINTRGLLIMTNDGDFANYMMHPSHNVNKTYEARVSGESVKRSADILRHEMLIDGYMVSGADVEKVSGDDRNAVLLITIHEGRNRQVRKMCANAGLDVNELCRISEGGITLGNLPAGKWRRLSNDEIQDILSEINSERQGTV